MDKDWTTGDKVTDRNIQSLHPLIRGLVYKGVKNLFDDKGIFCRVYCGKRSLEAQQKVYDEGTSKVKPGYSYHNYGLAFDCVKIDGYKALWNDYEEIVEEFKNLGFEWGYDLWKWDKPHFQMTFNMKCSELMKLPLDEEGFVKII